MSEIWKPVVGMDGLYEVSDQGRVRSLDRPVGHRWGGVAIKRGKVLKPKLDKYGYHFVGLWASGSCVQVKIHRLVALHFLPQSDLPEVNHKDFVKTNNAATNLEWSSRKGNQEHASNGGKFAAVFNPKRAKKLSPELAEEIRTARAAGMTYAALAKQFDVSGSVAFHVVHGNIWAIPSAVRKVSQVCE